jgi:hypothetical protein
MLLILFCLEKWQVSQSNSHETTINEREMEAQLLIPLQSMICQQHA